MCQRPTMTVVNHRGEEEEREIESVVIEDVFMKRVGVLGDPQPLKEYPVLHPNEELHYVVGDIRPHLLLRVD